MVALRASNANGVKRGTFWRGEQVASDKIVRAGASAVTRLAFRESG